MGLFGRDGASGVGDELSYLREEYEMLLAAHGERLNRYSVYRTELESSRAPEALIRADDYGQSAKDQNTQGRHRISLPFGQVLTVKHTARLALRMPDVIVDRRQETAYERYRSDTMEKLIWGTHRASNGDVQMADGAWDASQLGAACFELYFHPGRQMALFRELDPSTVLTVPGATNPHDFQRVYRFWEAPLASLRIEYAGKQFRGQEIDVRAFKASEVRGGIEVVRVVECCDKNRRIRFTVGESSVGLYEDVHGYGFVPCVVIPNIGPERCVWGWSDYEFIRDLVAYIPRLFSREADVIRQVANGAVIERKTGHPPELIAAIISKGGVIPAGRDGQVEPIKPPEIPAFAPAHADRALAMLKMLGFSPDADWGDSSATSGSDRSLQLQPSLQMAGLKQLNWSSGLARLYSMVFRILEQKMAGPAYFTGTVRAASSQKSQNFGFEFGPGLEPFIEDPTDDSTEPIEMPRTPKELFGGDYVARFLWQNRIDPDDPAFVASELNKMAQSAQSLQTTLERLGFQSPEDEMKKIEAEAQRFPWINSGRVALIRAQLSGQQGAGGGAAYDGGQSLDSAGETMASPDGRALDGDAMFGALPGNTPGTTYGNA